MTSAPREHCLTECLTVGRNGPYPLLCPLRLRPHRIHEVLGVQQVSAQGERSGVSSDDDISVSVRLVHDLHGLDSGLDPSRVEESVDVRKVSLGLIVDLLHRIVIEPVTLQHRRRTGCSHIHLTSESFRLFRKTESCPYRLQTEIIGLCATQCCHLLRIAVCLGP